MLTHLRKLWNDIVFAAPMASCASKASCVCWKRTRFTRDCPSSQIRRLLSRTTNLLRHTAQGHCQLLARLCLAAVDIPKPTKAMASYCSCTLYLHLQICTILVNTANSGCSLLMFTHILACHEQGIHKALLALQIIRQQPRRPWFPVNSQAHYGKLT